VTQAADVAATLLAEIDGARVDRFETAPGIVNLVAMIDSGRPGKRLVFNDHLDTFPLGEDLGWTVSPLGGTLRDGKLYGRGVSDMKGGIATSLVAARVLARHRNAWSGEIVVTLAGDEENMGSLGSRWLLENISHAKGDAMISGDVGSPLVVRFGEKGFVLDRDRVNRPACTWRTCPQGRQRNRPAAHRARGAQASGGASGQCPARRHRSDHGRKVRVGTIVGSRRG
jgi:succinyl-diaminopimelate desuccinylase